MLSNGQNSPVFEKAGTKFAHAKTKTVTFAQPNPVKSLVAKTCAGAVNAIYFKDGKNKLVDFFEATPEVSLEDSSLKLDVGEEIFGVYGVKDEHDYFSAFGFIVKVRGETAATSATKKEASLSKLSFVGDNSSGRGD